jgi:phosphoribosylglycinamide formyltransferase-1
MASRTPGTLPGVRVGLLVSGTGTIAEQMVAEGLPVAVVLADRPCRGLEMAAEHAVAAELVDRRAFGGFGAQFDRPAYTEALVAALERHGVELVVMAGFGTVLAEAAHRAYPHRVLNTHPALLPAFPGWHAVEDALVAGVAVTGCTVHLAELKVDTGPILAQQEVPVTPGDTAETLHERIKAVERWLYPATVRRVLRALRGGIPPASLPCLRGTVAEPLDPTSAGLGADDPGAVSSRAPTDPGGRPRTEGAQAPLAAVGGRAVAGQVQHGGRDPQRGDATKETGPSAPGRM